MIKRMLDRLPLQDRMLRVVEAAQTRRSDGSVKDPTTGISFDRRMVLPNNPWKMRVYASGGQSFADGTTATITFPNVSYDSSNGYNTGTNQWTVPISGWYDVKTACQLSPPANGANVYTMGPLKLSRVGDPNPLSESDPLSLYAPAGLGSNGACIPIIDNVFVNQGDVVYIQVTAVNAGAGTWFIAGTTPPSNGYITFWTMALTSG